MISLLAGFGHFPTCKAAKILVSSYVITEHIRSTYYCHGIITSKLVACLKDEFKSLENEYDFTFGRIWSFFHM